MEKKTVIEKNRLTAIIVTAFFLTVFTIFLVGNEQNAFAFETENENVLKAYDDFLDTSFAAMLTELDDDYADYYDQKEWLAQVESFEGDYMGIGVIFGYWEENSYPIVIAPIKDGPAARAGIEAEDLIMAIDGATTEGMTSDEAVSLMRGQAGTSVTIQIMKKRTGTITEVDLMREQIILPSVEGTFLDKNQGIVYVGIASFTEHTKDEFEAIIKELGDLGKINGVILDLRNNPGGSFRAALELGSLWIPAGEPLVWTANRYGITSVLDENGVTYEQPLVVLINKGSASSAEVLAGILKDYQKGVLVGEKSFGKGIVQTIFPLQDGSALKITTDRYLTPLQKNIHGIGIEPDYLLPWPETLPIREMYTLDIDKDVQLNEALLVIRTLVAESNNSKDQA